jgi:uncharacterized phage protein (TIGR01671 family)
MNREIKFRAWDDGRMVYMTGALASISRFFRVIRKDSILLQFTGLKDKNGKEIYEGDVVKCVANNDFKWPANGVVEYLPSSAGFAINVGRQSLDNDNCYYAHFWSHIDFEVIGNIYENPELLNSGQGVQECDATNDEQRTKS